MGVLHSERRAAKAIGRSIDIYYRDPERTARMDALNREFVPKGGLAFDIGAHLGDRCASFLRLGARAVAVEPQPTVFRALRLLLGQKQGLHLDQAAVGACHGTLSLHINTDNPTVSTASSDFIASTKGAEAWQGQTWDRIIEVPVVTLDELIAAHGRPDFIKIDVEGHEAEVLAGLSHPVPSLSFELTTIQRTVAYSALRRLAALGPYLFNLSLGEEHTLRSLEWVGPSQMAEMIEGLPQDANSGDIYARLDQGKGG